MTKIMKMNSKSFDPGMSKLNRYIDKINKLNVGKINKKTNLLSGRVLIAYSSFFWKYKLLF